MSVPMVIAIGVGSYFVIWFVLAKWLWPYVVLNARIWYDIPDDEDCRPPYESVALLLLWPMTVWFVLADVGRHLPQGPVRRFFTKRLFPVDAYKKVMPHDDPELPSF